jgi:aminoacyl tRNA synthase complex-interacting multifunctional protein 1
VRHLDFIQNSSLFGDVPTLAEKITVDPEEILYVKPLVDAKAEKERLKKEKAAAGGEAVLVDRTKEGKEKSLGEAGGAGRDLPPLLRAREPSPRRRRRRRRRSCEAATQPEAASSTTALLLTLN